MRLRWTAILAVGLLAACEGAPEKPVRELPGPKDVPSDLAKPDAADAEVGDLPEDVGDLGPDATPACGEPPLAAGCPCAGGAECQSGFCDRDADGPRCAVSCLSNADCDADSLCVLIPGGTGTERVCAFGFPRACAACTTDDDCVQGFSPYGAACHEFSEAGQKFRYCVPMCQGKDFDNCTCPEGFSNKASGRVAGDPTLCLPDGGSCGCTDEARVQGWEGLAGCERYYQDGDDDGYGTDSFRCLCGANGSFRATSDGDCNDTSKAIHPGASEACNDVDDDCNGQTDETFSLADWDEASRKKGDSCGTGACNGGLAICAPGGASLVCSTAENARTESCNDVDDDCDGQTDEDFVYLDKVNGAAVGKGLGCGTGVCTGGVTICDPAGGPQLVCDSAGNATVEDETSQRCDGQDNDCDGLTDEGYTYDGQTVFQDPADPAKGRSSCIGVGACSVLSGVVECGPGGKAAICSVNPGGSQWTNKVEACNNLDDDCNGFTDDGLTDPSRSGCLKVGVCGVYIASIKASCDGGQWHCDYSAVVGYQSDHEVTCDGLDNDCDGLTDEDFLVTDWDGTQKRKDQACGIGVCLGGKVVCAGNNLGVECSTAGKAAPEQCDGVDNDCNGLTDDGFNYLGTPVWKDLSDKGKGHSTCLGVGECGNAAGLVECTPDKTAARCSTNPGGTQDQSRPEACNLKDDDCDGRTDDGLDVNSADSPCGRLGVCADHLPVATCDGGNWICDYSAVPGYSASERCNAQDDNCNGQTDEGLAFTDWNGEPRAKTEACGTGPCAGGAVECAADGSGLVCSTAGNASREACDGVDNDCNGLTDEAFANPCDDGVSCTVDECVATPSPNCTHTPVSDTCTIGGQCYANGTEDPTQPCRYCNSAKDPNAWTSRTEGVSCNADGSGCTQFDSCKGGVCTAGTPKDCSGLTTFCAVGVCNSTGPDSASCRLDPRNEGFGCDDGAVCTKADKCVQGVCTGTAYSCDDSLPCTSDVCKGDGTCTHAILAGWCVIGNVCYAEGSQKPGEPCQVCSPAVNPQSWTSKVAGTTCDDGNPCTVTDNCQSGTCQGTAKDCNDSNPCTTDSCNKLKTVGDPCEHTVITGACNDGQACTRNDTCSTGVCTGTSYSCPAQLPCQTPTCDGAGGCQYPIKAGFCVIAGACVTSGTLRPGNVCQSCQPLVDTAAWSNVTNGTPCNDVNQCTTADQCQAGVCTGSGTLDCNDGNPCTDDTCDSVSGCVHTANALSCDDSNACTLNDQCVASQCKGTAKSCPSLNPVCQASSGTCLCGGTTLCDAYTADTCSGGNCLCGSNPACSDALNPQCAGGMCTCRGIAICNKTASRCDSANGCVCGTGTSACTPGNVCCDRGSGFRCEAGTSC